MAANVNAQAFVPEIWDASVMRTLEDNLVARKICRNYSDKVKAFGDTIYFNGLADPTVTAYAGTVSYENLAAGQVPLLIDKQYYYGFDVTDIEEAMANVDLKGSQSERAAYALKKNCDSLLLQTYSQADSGNVVTADATCDTSTILSDIGLLGQMLAQNNVNEGDMWCVIPPWVKLKLQLAGIKFEINEGINGKGGMLWAKELGFDIFVTNQVYNSGSVAAPVSYVMAGSYNAIGYAETLLKSEAIRSETAFATHVRGLHVFGYRVLKPKELAYCALTYAAESSI